MPRTKWTGEWAKNYAFKVKGNRPSLDETTYKRLKKSRYEKKNRIPNWGTKPPARKRKRSSSSSGEGEEISLDRAVRGANFSLLISILYCAMI